MVNAPNIIIQTIPKPELIRNVALGTRNIINKYFCFSGDMFGSYVIKKVLEQHEIPTRFVSSYCWYRNLNGFWTQKYQKESLANSTDFCQLVPIVWLETEAGEPPHNIIDICSDADPLVQLCLEKKVEYSNEAEVKRLMKERSVSEGFYIPKHEKFPWNSLNLLGAELRITDDSYAKEYIDPNKLIEQPFDPARKQRKTNDLVTTRFFEMWEAHMPDYQKMIAQEVLKEVGRSDLYDPEVAMPYNPDDAVPLP